MGVGASNNIHMQRDASMQHKGPEKFFDQFSVKIANFRSDRGRLVMQKRPIANINGDGTQGFIHWNGNGGISINPAAVTKGLLQGLSENNAGVFNGVVGINV